MTLLARYVITAGAAGLVGFAAAGYLRPRVLHESHTEYVDRWHETVVTRTVVDTRIRTVVQRVIEERRKDGTQITTHETEGTETEVAAREHTAREAEGSGEMVSRSVEKVHGMPRLHIGAMVGLSLKGQRVLGGEASYRLLGPITVGAWGLSSGHFGGSLGVTW